MSHARRPQDHDPADRLLARAAPEAYLRAWERALRSPLPIDDHGARLSVGVFRLGEERFALETAWIRQVHRPATIRPLPGRTNDVFRGLVNLRGQVELAADLGSLFGVPMDAAPDDPRMLLVRSGSARWAVLVDEMLDVVRVDAADARPAQVTVSKSAVHFTDRMIEVDGSLCPLLDGDRLFAGLERSVV